ncbi:unnamed protein product [Xylocopa violacea]|uniref:Mitochondrial import inner membrane translocase subunit Tim16 n=1 Tax=Xylocopa violacea TaxID=135666 RepID=A0ABP1NCV4_XYLVO
MGTQVVAKAFVRALRQEIAANREAARKTGGGVRDEIEAIEHNYKYLMEVNDRSKGGSFYIQSKVVRAKERIDEELKNMKIPPPKTDSTQQEIHKQM